MEELVKMLTDALAAAYEHLEWCGYGDSYERECARESKLEETILTALEAAGWTREE